VTETPDGGRRISLIVVNYNTAALASRMLHSAEEGADEVVVVDNASTEGSLDELAQEHPRARIIRSTRNLGYGAGANLGARDCTGDVLIVANPDIQISPDGLHALAAVVGQDGIGLAAPRFVDAAGAFLPSSHYRDPGLLTTLWVYSSLFGPISSRLRPGWNPTLRRRAEHESDHDTKHVLGALMAIDATAFRSIGGFDERFFLYREETDLCRRIREAGWRVRYVASVTATHDGDASSRDRRPVDIRPAAVLSHYRYIKKHRGLLVAVLAFLIGWFGGLLWVLTGPHRTWAKDSLGAHRAVWQQRRAL
jgi:N-acetylglucosaminyl-diphospho-decaprenol L-rhamnosyltransferase